MNSPLNIKKAAVTARGPDDDGYTEYRDDADAILGWTHQATKGRLRTELRVRGLTFSELLWVTIYAAIEEDRASKDTAGVMQARWLLGLVKCETDLPVKTEGLAYATIP